MLDFILQPISQWLGANDTLIPILLVIITILLIINLLRG